MKAKDTFTLILWFNSWISSINRRFEVKDWVIREISWISWIEFDRWRISRVLVDISPRPHHSYFRKYTERRLNSFKDRAISCVCASTSIGQMAKETLILRVRTVRTLRTRSRRNMVSKSHDLRNDSVEMMNFYNRHIFRKNLSLCRGSLKSKGWGKLSSHYIEIRHIHSRQSAQYLRTYLELKRRTFSTSVTKRNDE